MESNIDNNISEIKNNKAAIGIESLRDHPTSKPTTYPLETCPYDHIIEMIRKLDLQDDGIVMNHKIKSIEMDFCSLVRDENMLCESMEYINDKALADGETALKFALLFSSRNFDALAMKETKIRSAMLKILEANFLNADAYRSEDKDRFYNSITLLGEYYHRVRLADNSPILILGESLLGLLIREVSGNDKIDEKLAKLILSQITLNGDIMRVKHKTELTQLLYHIRRNLIEQKALNSSVKALLLMTLDLYYSNFTNLGAQLEEMYTKYLVHSEDDESSIQGSCHQSSPSPAYSVKELTCSDNHGNICHNRVENLVNDSCPPHPSTKKWSEQVCEESFNENDFGIEDFQSSSGLEQSVDQQENLNVSTSSERFNNDLYGKKNNSGRRSYKTNSSPRPLKQNIISKDSNDVHRAQKSNVEETDQAKPLPRWRAPRFNRDTADYQDERMRHHHRVGNSFDEDRESIHSDGGSIRLYSINDRLKHSQEKIERSGVNNYNSIANSNWDRQSYDDRSERSYISNYERGNYKRGSRHYQNRQYDKPPRFQKNQSNNNNMHNDAWRPSRRTPNFSYQDENSWCRFNDSEANSRSLSRNRTFPRKGKSNAAGEAHDTPSHRQSESPTGYHRSNSTRQRNSNPHYSSHSSLNSDVSNSFDRHNNQRNRNFVRLQKECDSTNYESGQSEKVAWNSKDSSNELVRNARQTTKYMNYLSSKK